MRIAATLSSIGFGYSHLPVYDAVSGYLKKDTFLLEANSGFGQFIKLVPGTRVHLNVSIMNNESELELEEEPEPTFDNLPEVTEKIVTPSSAETVDLSRQSSKLVSDIVELILRITEIIDKAIDNHFNRRRRSSHFHKRNPRTEVDEHDEEFVTPVSRDHLDTMPNSGLNHIEYLQEKLEEKTEILKELRSRLDELKNGSSKSE